MVELLKESGDLLEDPKPITHPVKFYEKGDRPLEIVSTRQWYINNGARDAALADRLVELGRQIDWHPEFMRVRYENWVGGLSGDWLVSRQRFFGVPIPVWYPVDEAGETVFDSPIVPTRDQLPVDPTTDTAPGYDESQRGAPGGFVPEMDILDTWATSSLTPQIAGGWERDAELFDAVFPYDLRPQAQDIIRTWLFSSVLRAQLEDGVSPWAHAAISGFIVDPDRKKMSKSKGNVVTPADILEQHGSDAVRYWAASSRLGTDAAFDPQNPTQIKIGRRLAIKVLNAAKFILSFPTGTGDVTEALDRSMLAELSSVVSEATKALDGYDHARALELTESFFWTFCDDYLELVKERAYGQGQGAVSAAAALRLALSTLLRLFAPYIPFATEETWSWFQSGSVHRAEWPTADALGDAAGEATPLVLTATSRVLTGIRRAKTSAKVSQKAPIARAIVTAPEEELWAIEQAAADIRAVGRIVDLQFVPGDELSVEVELGDEPSA
jgi:valyl-tRNA synthetase